MIGGIFHLSPFQFWKHAQEHLGFRRQDADLNCGDKYLTKMYRQLRDCHRVPNGVVNLRLAYILREFFSALARISGQETNGASNIAPDVEGRHMTSLRTIWSRTFNLKTRDGFYPVVAFWPSSSSREKGRADGERSGGRRWRTRDEQRSGDGSRRGSRDERSEGGDVSRNRHPQKFVPQVFASRLPGCRLLPTHCAEQLWRPSQSLERHKRDEGPSNLA